MSNTTTKATTTATIAALFIGSAAAAQTIEDNQTTLLTPADSFDQSVCTTPVNVYLQEDGPDIQNAILNLAFATWGATTSTFDVEGHEDINISYTSRSDRGFVPPTYYLHQEIDGKNHTCHISEDTFKSFEIDYDAMCKDRFIEGGAGLDDLYRSFFRSAADQGKYLVVEHIDVEDGPVFFQTALFEDKETAETPIEDRNEDPTEYGHMMYQPDEGSVCSIQYEIYVGLQDIHWLARPQHFVPNPNPGQPL